MPALAQSIEWRGSQVGCPDPSADHAGSTSSDVEAASDVSWNKPRKCRAIYLFAHGNLLFRRLDSESPAPVGQFSGLRPNLARVEFVASDHSQSHECPGFQWPEAFAWSDTSSTAGFRYHSDSVSPRFCRRFSFAAEWTERLVGRSVDALPVDLFLRRW